MPDGPKNPDKKDLGWSQPKYETIVDITRSGEVKSVRHEPVPDKDQDPEYIESHNFFGPKVEVIDVTDGQIEKIGIERVYEGEKTEEERTRRNKEQAAENALKEAGVLQSLQLVVNDQWRGAELVEVRSKHEDSEDTYLNGYALRFPLKWTEEKEVKRFMRRKKENVPFDTDVSLSVTYFPRSSHTPKYELEQHHSPARLLIEFDIDKRIASTFDSNGLFKVGHSTIDLETGGSVRHPQPIPDVKYKFREALLDKVVGGLSELGITPASLEGLSQERMKALTKD